MRIGYLPVNQVYVVLFGDSPQTLYGASRAIGTYFHTLAHVDWALRQCGLRRVGRKIELAS